MDTLSNNVIFPVVGEKEKAAGTVNVRTRDNIVHGEMTLQQLLDHFSNLAKTRSLAEDTLA